MADAGEGLAPEAVRGNRGQILELLELGRGETLAEDGQIFLLRWRMGLVREAWSRRGRSVEQGQTHLDAAAVVRNLQKFQTTLLNDHLDGRRARIHGVFHEFLQGVDRRNNDFTRRNLVDDILVKGLDYGSARLTPLDRTRRATCLDTTRRQRFAQVIGLSLSSPRGIEIHHLGHGG